MFDPDLYHDLARGMSVTIQITGLAIVVGTVIGLAGGIASMSGTRVIRWVTAAYVEVFRGVSALILLFWAAYSLPLLFPFSVSPFAAGVIALSTNMGAYATELVRGAIKSVPAGQSEAAISVNLSPAQRLRHVILPQAILVALPPYGNLCIEVLKASSLVSLIALNDVMRVAQTLRSNQVASGIAIFGAVLVIYFVLSSIITLLVRLAERHFSRHLNTRPGMEVSVK